MKTIINLIGLFFDFAGWMMEHRILKWFFIAACIVFLIAVAWAGYTIDEWIRNTFFR